MSDRTRNGSSSRRTAYSSGRTPRGESPSALDLVPVEDAFIIAATPGTTEVATVAPGSSGALAPPTIARVAASSPTPISVARTTVGT